MYIPIGTVVGVVDVCESNDDTLTAGTSAMAVLEALAEVEKVGYAEALAVLELENVGFAEAVAVLELENVG
jgi:hypothetical protein